MSIPGTRGGRFPARASAAAAFGAAMLTLAGCNPPAPATPAAQIAIPPGQARLWLYRAYEPSLGFNLANIDLDGARIASVPAFGPGIYRDVAPGRHRVAAEGLVADSNQSVDVSLAPGQEMFLKIEDVPISWGDLSAYDRDVFYVRPVSPELARAQLAANPQ